MMTAHPDYTECAGRGEPNAGTTDLTLSEKLIECLKNCAATENTSVNALAERLTKSSLQASAAGEEYLRLAIDPDEALCHLYRQLILGQSLGASVLSRDTLQFLLELAHQGYINRLRVIS